MPTVSLPWFCHPWSLLFAEKGNTHPKAGCNSLGTLILGCQCDRIQGSALPSFSGPISAIVIYPAIRYVSEMRSLWLGVILTILGVDIFRSAKEASAVYSDFYRHEFERQFSIMSKPEFSGDDSIVS